MPGYPLEICTIGLKVVIPVFLLNTLTAEDEYTYSSVNRTHLQSSDSANTKIFFTSEERILEYQKVLIFHRPVLRVWEGKGQTDCVDSKRVN